MVEVSVLTILVTFTNAMIRCDCLVLSIVNESMLLLLIEYFTKCYQTLNLSKLQSYQRLPLEVAKREIDRELTMTMVQRKQKIVSSVCFSH
jgi:hypothetical protein